LVLVMGLVDALQKDRAVIHWHLRDLRVNDYWSHGIMVVVHWSDTGSVLGAWKTA